MANRFKRAMKKVLKFHRNVPMENSENPLVGSGITQGEDQNFSRRTNRMLDEDPSISEKIKKIVNENPSISAKFFPYLENEPTWIIPKRSYTTNERADEGFPVPPRELWAGYGESPAEYLSSGRAHVETMRRILEDSGFSFQEGGRILDFGCAAGRMTRYLHDLTRKYEIWGVDVTARHILWCQQHLSPPFRFATTTTFPHLPFEDRYFNLIYACSVFTHICDLGEAWLLELKRILCPAGRIYITIHDNHTVELLLSSPPGHWLHDTLIRQQLLTFEEKTHFLSTGFSMFTLQREPGNAQVFHDIDFLRENWGRFLQVLSVVPEAYGYQTAIILGR